MAAKLRFRNAVVCEFATPGPAGKWNLINVFPSDITVSEFPVVLPLGFYLEHLPDQGAPTKMSLEVIVDGQLIGRIDARRDNPQSEEVATIVVGQIPIHAFKDSVVEVVAAAEGYRKVTVISRRIYKN
jgi:hypothetical protein